MSSNNQLLNYTITEASEITSLSQSILRIWELRYKWPKPKRGKNGYRIYSQQDIASLHVISHFLNQGRCISEILEDRRISPLYNPLVSMDTLYPRRGPAALLDFTEVPLPETSQGKELRQKLEAAIQEKNSGRIAYLEAESSRLPPAERQLAAVAILAIARKHFPLTSAGAR